MPRARSKKDAGNVTTVPPAKASKANGNGANLGFEAQMFFAADKLRKNLEHRDSARANIRRHVKRLLRKYGYPPDLQDAAVQNVLQQAQALSAEWAA
jgi:hypothetical protein